MRICVTGLRGMPDVQGGVEAHCEHLLPRVAARLPNGAELTVCVRSPYARKDLTDYLGVRIVRLWTLKHKALEALLHTALSVLHARFRQKADLIHIHAIGPALLSPFARALGLRVVVTHHGADYRREKWGAVAKSALRLGELLAVTFAERVIVVSRSATDSLKSRHPKASERIVFIPNGLPPAAQAGASPPGIDPLQRFDVEPGKFILSVGRLVPEKGFMDIIEAAAQVGEDGPPILIAGGADHEDAYVRRLKAAAGPRVRFVGYLGRAELARLYATCGLFVLASHHEGLPIAALEAIGAGAPVLLSDIEANCDLGLDPVCYFPVGDVAALAARLRAPFAPGGPRARPDLAMFDWERSAIATSDVYTGVLGARPA